MSFLRTRAGALKLSAFVVVMSALIMPSFGGCGLSPAGNDTRPSGNDAGPPKCDSAVHCDDGNPCTVDLCGEEGLCAVTPVDGDPPSQPIGDCKRITCQAGAPTEVADDTDVDDGNTCTKDVCQAGAPTHTNADGDPCLLGSSSGVCKVGACVVSCASASDSCDDTNPCTEDACDLQLGECVHDAAKLHGSLVSDRDLGDCTEKRCKNGVSTDVPDDSEIPDDKNDCTTDACVAGVIVHTDLALDTTCGLSGGMFCNGLGQCVQCNDPTQCGVDDDCNTFTCTAKVCGVDYTAAGTTVSAQTAGDCQIVQCNGTGGLTSADDNGDFPDDANDCTNDLCTLGVEGHTNVGLGAACTNILGSGACDGNGICKKPVGQPCALPIDCSTSFCADGRCCDTACTTTCKSCAVAGALGTCSDIVAFGKDNAPANACNGNNSCDGGGVCRKDNGQTCAIAGDCTSGNCVDGRCCNTTCTGTCLACNIAGSLGTCSNIAQLAEDTFPAATCDGVNSCDGAGGCKKDSGQVCAVAADCSSGFCADGRCCNVACSGTCRACDVSGLVGTCSNIPQFSEDNAPANTCVGANSCDGAGGCKKDTGQTCAAPGDCSSGFCADGRCCDAACTATCRACNLAGVEGTCSNIPALTEDPNANSTCVGSNSCNGAGTCTKDNGQTCALPADCSSGNCIDGRCCNSACGGTCQACNVAGSLGTCSNLPALQKDNFPVNTCVGINACDGAGNCKEDNGQVCAVAADCASGNCVDGRCCNSTCTGTCKACNVATLEGTCSNVPGFSEDDFPVGTCTGVSSCDGAGVCKKDNGQTCALPADCTSGNCVDGRCCNSTCTGTCKACNVAGIEGTCSNVPQFSTDLFPAGNACSGTNSCDGAGNCKKADGQTCVGPADCSGANCVDGYCCNSTCTTLCKACNVAGLLGTCSNIPALTEDTFPAGSCDGINSCNGAAGCTKDNGQTCVLAADCSSGNCVDGRCCNSGCGTTCKSCNVVGLEGLCSNIPAQSEDTFPANACTGVTSCNGSGVCTKDNGQTCALPADCSSGNCVDGYCCTSSCTAACKACNVAGSEGACSNIPAPGEDTFPANVCNGVNSCNGAGTCTKDNGQTCSLPADCTSGNCVDGYCCNSTCTTACMACNVGGSLGACSNIPAPGEDTFPANACNGVNSCNGSGTCTKDNGQTCAIDAVCTSGHCVDGVCCDTTCVGNCSACSMAKKGTGSDGVCGFVVNGGDPDNNCTDGGAATCGDDGACNGAGVCRKYIAGTVCLAGSCSVTTQTNAKTCDGAGTCNSNGTLACTPYICGPTACKTTCAMDNDCIAGDYCTMAGACVPQKALGSVCAGANECTSAFCADGVCCNTACTTACLSCDLAGTVGMCSNIPAPGEDTFPANACNGVNSCNGSGTCTKDNGQTCAIDAVCTSGHCVDGVCCDTTCAGSCSACSAAKKGSGSDGVCGFVANGGDPDDNCTDSGVASCGDDGSCNGAGACRKYAAGTICLAQSCSMTTQTNAKTCDGAGTCGSNGTVACTPYICGPTACKTLCAMDSDCIAGDYCTMAGACVPQKALGDMCAGANECTSAFCADGVCCNTACGSCLSCLGAVNGGTDGTCGNVPNGMDPTNDCADQLAASCGNDGSCNGAGACRKYPAATVCLASSCASGVQTNAKTCDGAGTCNSNGTLACTPFVCGPTACLVTCGTDVDCIGTDYCSGGSCLPKQTNGTSCSAMNQCTSGNCSDTVCCDTACGAACQGCNEAGTEGACTTLPMYTMDSLCAANEVCATTAVCKLANGETCTNGGQCASGNCTGGGTKTCTP